MTKTKTAKALLASVLALVLCVSMLVGTTFAWFTDSVTSAGNIIKSGTLDVEMGWADGKVDPTTAAYEDASKGAIFDYDLWEPGYTEVRHIQIENKGTLALKYQLNILATGEVSQLADVIDVYFMDPAQAIANRTELNDANKIGTLTEVLANVATSASGELLAGANSTITLALKMQESAGNEYQNLSIGSDFAVQLLATQLTYESDDFGPEYDAPATYPMSASGNAAVDGSASYELPLLKGDGGKVGSATFMADSVADDAEDISIKVLETNKNANLSVADDQDARTFEITVSGLKDNNQTPVKVQLNVGAGLTGVELYHHETLIASTYDPNTGLVKFETTSFSPFTVVFDAEPVEEEVEDVKPKASVVEAPQFVGVPLAWENYGSFSPSDPYQTLEAAYVFTDITEIPVEESLYQNWECDYFVSMDRDVPAGTVFLGGNYGSWGWIGFESPEFVAANVEVPLLGSVTQNPWTYADVANFVETFTCGVAHLDECLNGATFTVVLRLTNPENDADTYDVATVKYTFGELPAKFEKVATAEELAAAMAAGGNYVLTSDINVSETSFVVPGGKTAVLAMNGKEISGTFENTSNANKTLFEIKGNLTVAGEGTITMNTTGNNMGWNAMSCTLYVNGGDLTVNDTTVVNEDGKYDAKGTDMAYAIDTNPWNTAGNDVLDVVLNNAKVESGYFGVRVRDNGPYLVKVVANDSAIDNIWYQEYAEAGGNYGTLVEVVLNNTTADTTYVPNSVLTIN